jgi:carboxyl-terminal processing protease
MPDIYEYTKIREKDNPESLPWDEVEKTPFDPWKYKLDLIPIKKASEQRIKGNEIFNVIQQNAKWMADRNDKEYSLSLKKYQEESKQIRSAVKQIESVSKTTREMDMTALEEDLKKLSYDQGKLERYKQWVKSLRTDIYLTEAVQVLNDMVDQKNLVYNPKK